MGVYGGGEAGLWAVCVGGGVVGYGGRGTEGCGERERLWVVGGEGKVVGCRGRGRLWVVCGGESNRGVVGEGRVMGVVDGTAGLWGKVGLWSEGKVMRCGYEGGEGGEGCGLWGVYEVGVVISVRDRKRVAVCVCAYGARVKYVLPELCVRL